MIIYDAVVILDLRGPPGAPGPGLASQISYDDSVTQMGVSTMQEAIAFLAARLGFPESSAPNLDFSKPANSENLPEL